MYSIETDGKDTELIKATAVKWAQLLNLNAGEFIIRVEPGGHNCYYYGGDRVEISVSPLFDEYLLAHELAHVAMGQKIDLCFSQFIFSTRLKVEEEKDNLFMRQVAGAGRLQDVWVDEIIYGLDPDLILQDKQKDNPHISFLAENPAKAKEALSIGIEGIDFYTYLALNKGETIRLGIEPYFPEILAAIDTIYKNMDKPSQAKLNKMVSLIESLPQLPGEKKESVSLFRRAVQEVCWIFDFPKPTLLYDEELWCYVWSN